MEGLRTDVVLAAPFPADVPLREPPNPPSTPDNIDHAALTGNSPGSPLLMLLVDRQMESKSGSEYRTVSWHLPSPL